MNYHDRPTSYSTVTILKWPTPPETSSMLTNYLKESLSRSFIQQEESLELNSGFRWLMTMIYDDDMITGNPLSEIVLGGILKINWLSKFVAITSRGCNHAGCNHETNFMPCLNPKFQFLSKSYWMFCFVVIVVVVVVIFQIWFFFF